MGRGSSLSHPGGWGLLAPRAAVNLPRFVVLFLCLVSFLPWGFPPPQTKQSFSVVSRRGLQGPSYRTGGGATTPHPHTSSTPEPPQSPAQLVPRHFQNPGIRASCPFPPPPHPSTGTVEGLKAWQCQGSRPEGTSLATGSLGWLRGPQAHSSFLCQSMEKLAAGHGIPSLPCSVGRSRARWEL